MFLCDFDNKFGDIAIVFASSFDEALNTYKDQRKCDLVTQFMYDYGEFANPIIPLDEKRKEFEEMSKTWHLGKSVGKPPMDQGVRGDDIRYCVYPGGRCSSITVIELSHHYGYDYKVICDYGLHNKTVADRATILKLAAEKLHERYRDRDECKVGTSIQKEFDEIGELLLARRKAKEEMYKYSSDSEEYKAAKKKVDDLKKEINRLFSENDDMMINFKEKGNNNE